LPEKENEQFVDMTPELKKAIQTVLRAHADASQLNVQNDFDRYFVENLAKYVTAIQEIQKLMKAVASSDGRGIRKL
jgi:hypothetical protein